MLPEPPRPRALVLVNSSLQTTGIAVACLLLGALCLWVYGHVPPQKDAWVAAAIGGASVFGGVWMIVFSPWWRVEIDPATRRIIADSGTRFHKKRRVVPFSAVATLGRLHIGNHEGGHRYALAIELRDGSRIQVGDFSRDLGSLELDRINVSRALGDALPEAQRPPRGLSGG